MEKPEDIDDIRAQLQNAQETICRVLSELDPEGTFTVDQWERPDGGGGESRAFTGEVFEKAGVNFSDVGGPALPPSASARRPELAGRSFQAMGVSVVIHPRNPYAPTSHANVRYFLTEKPGEEPVWWFGGGFDLTPYYGFEEDAQDWHRAARECCEPYGEDLYPRLKQWCDDYFALPHRNEQRGIGGLFFDDYNEGGFEAAKSFTLGVAKTYAEAYRAIVARRKDTPYGERERRWQTIRRGRYVEFNLLYDRGTLFGLQSKGRTESILMSLPPEVRWEYGHTPEQGTPEAELLEKYLVPRDWV